MKGLDFVGDLLNVNVNGRKTKTKTKTRLKWEAGILLVLYLPAFQLPAVAGILSQADNNDNSHAMSTNDDRHHTSRQDAQLLWHSYVPNYMEQFFTYAILNGSNSIINEEHNVSEQCGKNVRAWIEQLIHFRENPLQTQTWALHMIDSWGKPPEGILSGHVNAMGDFDECVGLRGPALTPGSSSSSPQSSNIASSVVSGLYCTTYIVHPVTPHEHEADNSNGMTQHVLNHAVSIVELERIIALKSDIKIHPSIANCFPSSCSQEDVQSILTNYFRMSNFTSDYSVSPVVGTCTTDRKPDFNAGDIVMIVILTILVFLCFLATLIDVSSKGKKGNTSPTSRKLELLLSFSLSKNTKFLLSTTPGSDTLTCFYGLRFLSMAWIILMHTWGMLVASQTSWNLVDVKLIYKENWSSFLVHNGLVSVDTFFTMGGLLVSYNLLKSFERNQGKINLPIHYLHRYLRLTPAYALIVGILATLLPYLSSGPNWYVMDMWALNCRRNWWHNLLYINNLVDYGSDFASNGMCAGLSWYLSADMQFFIISPFLIYPLWRWARVGKLILGLCTLGSIVSPGVIAYVYHLVPTLITSRGDEALLTTRLLYFKPWTRAGPYIVGIWTGYFLFKTAGGTSFKLPKRIIVACWLISTATALAVLLGIRSYFDPTYDIPKAGGAFYAGLHRFVWGLVIAWIIVACVKGYAGWINSFLSWHFFVPLSRLTFCMYLVSYFIQMTLHLRLRQPFYYDSYTMVNLFFAHLTMSILVSYILTVLLELPFLHIDKILFGSFKNSRTSKADSIGTAPVSIRRENV